MSGGTGGPREEVSDASRGVPQVALSGFLRADFLLAFDVGAAGAREALEALCEGEWQGERIARCAYELTTPMSPDALEERIAPLLSEGDHAVFYYLADSKRMFRVALVG